MAISLFVQTQPELSDQVKNQIRNNFKHQRNILTLHSIHWSVLSVIMWRLSNSNVHLWAFQKLRCLVWLNLVRFIYCRQIWTQHSGVYQNTHTTKPEGKQWLQFSHKWTVQSFVCDGDLCDLYLTQLQGVFNQMWPPRVCCIWYTGMCWRAKSAHNRKMESESRSDLTWQLQHIKREGLFI